MNDLSLQDVQLTLIETIVPLTLYVVPENVAVFGIYRGRGVTGLVFVGAEFGILMLLSA